MPTPENGNLKAGLDFGFALLLLVPSADSAADGSVARGSCRFYSRFKPGGRFRRVEMAAPKGCKGSSGLP